MARMIDSFSTFIEKTPWGSYSITALYLSLFSGVVVALQYNPTTPYYSAASLDTVVPFGKFWRSLHFYSSQIFFLLASTHFLSLVFMKKHRQIPFGKWISLVSSIFVLLMILFTGYILRGDSTGSFAGNIAENILLSVPFFGETLNSFLFSIESSGMVRVYPNHIVGLCLVWLFLSWSHVRRYTLSWRQNALVSISIILFSTWFSAPIDPEHLGVFKVNGPWFFIGLQEALRYFPPLWAGIVFPMLFFGALCIVNRGGVIERAGSLFALAWFIVYLLLTFLGL